MRYLIYIVISAFFFSCSPKQKTIENEILWDTWGIPHIYATSDQELYKMMGWAQMRNHGDLLLKLYGESRGRSGEYWGVNIERDELLHKLGIIDAAQKAYKNLPDEEKEMLYAFTAGINAYSSKNPDSIDMNYHVVLPVEPQDIIYHTFRVLYLEFLINRNLQSANKWTPGSNAWAVNGAKTSSGNSMLLANPHLPWNDFWLFFEAHYITEYNDLYGVTLVGFPTIGIGFNEKLGWTHTVNTLDNVDLYELTINKNQYKIDNDFKDFEIDSVNVILNTDSSRTESMVYKKRSEFGMVYREDGGKAIVIQWPNMDGQFNVLGQWRAMGEAQSLKEFKSALDMNALPLFNVIYSDKENNILYHFCGNIPKKNGNWRKWQSVVPGNSSDELWQGYYSNDELPGYVNPESGWIQNANDPPYTSTIPPAILPDNYPSHIAPNYMTFRPQRSARLIQGSENLTLEKLIVLKHDTKSELALRIREELESLKETYEDSLSLAALNVLTTWDGSFDASSKGAVLFINLINEIGTGGYFDSKWSFQDPLETPDGFRDDAYILKSLKKVARNQFDQIGTLSVAYGDLFRLKVGDYEYAGNGGSGYLGLFRTLNFSPGSDGKFYSVHGDSFVCAVEFGETVEAKALLSYGNATQENNSHVGDQLNLYVEKKLRDVWLTREAQEANLESIEKLRDM